MYGNAAHFANTSTSLLSANVDRIWTLWQNYYGHPSVDPGAYGFEVCFEGFNANKLRAFCSANSLPTTRSITARTWMYSSQLKVTEEDISVAQPFENCYPIKA